MQLEHALLAVVLNHSNEGIHMVDTGGVTKYYNAAAATMDGLKPGEVVGKHVLEVFPSLDAGTSTLLKVARTGKPITNQQQIYTNVKGANISTVNTTLPVFGRGGMLLGAVEVSRDISGIRRLAEQVVDLRRRLHCEDPAQRPGGATYHFHDIIGESASLKRVLTRGTLAAHSDSPIMVVGETGVGKELLVQSIHNESLRRARPFVAQDCAALPESLLDAILFGSVKGSFTGAMDRPGLFELANGGTLFLDELNAMPRQLQAKLLRVLETGELRRLGDAKVKKVNVRTIAALSADPRRALRPDLYYRLNVITLELPPLRKRREDIPLLCSYFLDRFNAHLGTRVEGIAEQAMTALRSWSWPGNVRELSNCIEGCLIYRSEGMLELDDLPEYLRSLQANKDLRYQVEEFEQEIIFEIMMRTEGNISQAAELLGIPRQTLQRRLQKYRWHETCIKKG